MPPPDRTADLWADQCRVLPRGTPEPGPWRSARAPYMIPIMRDFSDPRYTDIVAVMGAQMGKTDAMLNVMSHRIDDSPTPILYIGPTQKNVESFSSDRFRKMVDSTPSIKGKLAGGKKDKITEKYFSGVRVGFGWAGSATELASHPVGLALIDERDRMTADTGGEGDPLELVRARTSNYSDGKQGIFSTPTMGSVDTEIDEETGLERWKISDGIQSPIWRLWQSGTRHEWAWPCPDCREYFIPRLRLLWWPEDCTPNQALKSATLVCPHCGCFIGNEHKHAMNASGVYVAPGQRITTEGLVIGDPPETPIVSRWVSGLCSPWQSFGQRARAFIEAARSGSPERVQAVLNTRFGELFSVSAEAMDWKIVADHRAEYTAGQIPDGVHTITCGVDVQKSRLVYAVRGWGVGLESWLISYGELWGETDQGDVWLQLSDLLDDPACSIKMMLIDSGYRPGTKWRSPDNMIYDFCRRHRGRVYPSKGHDRLDKPAYASKIDVTIRGATVKGGLNLWHIDSDHYKSWVHSRLEWPDDKPGAWHIPTDTSDDYCKQIVAEARTVKPSGHVTWVKVRKDNHYLDCEALNAAIAGILRLQSEIHRPAAKVQRVVQQPQPQFGRSEWGSRL